jgi:hypothetical protein
MLVIESMNSALPDNGDYTAKSNNAKLWLIYLIILYDILFNDFILCQNLYPEIILPLTSVPQVIRPRSCHAASI